jgi:hypothetical protein
MGTWGDTNFENDQAMDTLGELTDEPNLAMLISMLDPEANNAASESGEDGSEIDHRANDDVDEIRSFVAIEIVAAMAGVGSKYIPVEAQALSQKFGRAEKAVIETAVQRLEQLLARSSVGELMEEDLEEGQTSDWRILNEDLLARLKGVN